MKTKLIDPIDITSMLDTIPTDAIPSEADIDLAVRKRLTKDFLTLRDLGTDEPVQKGDSLTVSVVGPIPKFNKAKLPLTIGNHLYSAPLEDALVGVKTGESRTVTLEEIGEVTATVLSARRKSAPEPTDEMAAAQGVENVRTVAEYRAWLREQMLTVSLAGILGEILDKVKEEVEFQPPAPEDLSVMKQLEADACRDYFRREKGMDPETMSSEQFQKEFHAEDLQTFIKTLEPMHIGQLKNIQLLNATFGIEPVGEFDPAGTKYGAHSRMFQKACNIVYERINEKKRCEA